MHLLRAYASTTARLAIAAWLLLLGNSTAQAAKAPTGPPAKVSQTSPPEQEDVVAAAKEYVQAFREGDLNANRSQTLASRLRPALSTLNADPTHVLLYWIAAIQSSVDGAQASVSAEAQLIQLRRLYEAWLAMRTDAIYAKEPPATPLLLSYMAAYAVAQQAAEPGDERGLDVIRITLAQSITLLTLKGFVPSKDIGPLANYFASLLPEGHPDRPRRTIAPEQEIEAAMDIELGQFHELVFLSNLPPAQMADPQIAKRNFQIAERYYRRAISRARTERAKGAALLALTRLESAYPKIDAFGGRAEYLKKLESTLYHGLEVLTYREQLEPEDIDFINVKVCNAAQFRQYELGTVKEEDQKREGYAEMQRIGDWMARARSERGLQLAELSGLPSPLSTDHWANLPDSIVQITYDGVFQSFYLASVAHDEAVKREGGEAADPNLASRARAREMTDLFIAVVRDGVSRKSLTLEELEVAVTYAEDLLKRTPPEASETEPTRAALAELIESLKRNPSARPKVLPKEYVGVSTTLPVIGLLEGEQVLIDNLERYVKGAAPVPDIWAGVQAEAIPPWVDMSVDAALRRRADGIHPTPDTASLDPHVVARDGLDLLCASLLAREESAQTRGVCAFARDRMSALDSGRNASPDAAAVSTSGPTTMPSAFRVLAPQVSDLNAWADTYSRRFLHTQGTPLGIQAQASNSSPTEWSLVTLANTALRSALRNASSARPLTWIWSEPPSERSLIVYLPLPSGWYSIENQQSEKEAVFFILDGPGAGPVLRLEGGSFSVPGL